jgi:hypothetical protein
MLVPRDLPADSQLYRRAAITDPIHGGGLRDLNNLARHYYYSDKRSNRDTSGTLAFMGAVTVAIGCKMLWTAWEHTKAGRGMRGHGLSR